MMFVFLCCVCALRTKAMKRATIDMTKAEPLDFCTCLFASLCWLRKQVATAKALTKACLSHKQRDARVGFGKLTLL